MEWAQLITLISAMAGMFLWNRSEANSDRRNMTNLIKAIEVEMKDFHGRLCAIEERNKK